MDGEASAFQRCADEPRKVRWMEMDDQKVKDLTSAAKAGQVIRIVYHGGSQPGTVREVSPIVVATEEMRARDMTSGIVKTFLLSKVEIAGAEDSVPEYDPNAPKMPPETFTIRECITPYVEEIEKLGWFLSLTDTSASVHRFFKNGKPRKGAEVALLYEPFVTDFTYDIESNDFIEENRESTRPYRVESRAFASARPFGIETKAVALFLEEVRNRATADAP
jgi:hypothetical protein